MEQVTEQGVVVVTDQLDDKHQAVKEILELIPKMGRASYEFINDKWVGATLKVSFLSVMDGNEFIQACGRKGYSVKEIGGRKEVLVLIPLPDGTHVSSIRNIGDIDLPPFTIKAHLTLQEKARVYRRIAFMLQHGDAFGPYTISPGQYRDIEPVTLSIVVKFKDEKDISLFHSQLAREKWMEGLLCIYPSETSAEVLLHSKAISECSLALESALRCVKEEATAQSLKLEAEEFNYSTNCVIANLRTSDQRRRFSEKLLEKTKGGRNLKVKTLAGGTFLRIAGLMNGAEERIQYLSHLTEPDDHVDEAFGDWEIPEIPTVFQEKTAASASPTGVPAAFKPKVTYADLYEKLAFSGWDGLANTPRPSGSRMCLRIGCPDRTSAEGLFEWLKKEYPGEEITLADGTKSISVFVVDKGLPSKKVTQTKTRLLKEGKIESKKASPASAEKPKRRLEIVSEGAQKLLASDKDLAQKILSVISESLPGEIVTSEKVREFVSAIAENYYILPKDGVISRLDDKMFSSFKEEILSESLSAENLRELFR